MRDTLHQLFLKTNRQVRFAIGLSLGLALSLSMFTTRAQAYPDPVFPIPLTEPLPFPWDTIQGIWQARVNNQLALFSFEVQDDNNGRKTLRVLQLDAAAKVIVASGRGFIDEKTNTVRAGMVGKSGTFMLFVGLYKNEKLKDLPAIVTVLTTRKFQDQSVELTTLLDKVVGRPFTEAEPAKP